MKILIMILTIVIAQSSWGKSGIYHPGCYKVDLDIGGNKFVDYLRISKAEDADSMSSQMRGKVNGMYLLPESGGLGVDEGTFSYSFWGGATTYRFTFIANDNGKDVKFDFFGRQRIDILFSSLEILPAGGVEPIEGELSIYESVEDTSLDGNIRAPFKATFVHNDPNILCADVGY